MKPTFSVTSTGELVSGLTLRSSPHQVTVGTAVTLARPYITEYGAVPAGAKGTVVHVDDDMGTIEIRMKAYHRALFHWKNTLVVSPYTCEDLTTCIKLPVDNSPPLATQSVPLGGTVHELTT